MPGTDDTNDAREAPATLTVRSSDGTSVAAHVSGSGRPLVLVHGVAGEAARWITSRRLAEHFRLYAVDRRGRGASGDGERYAIEREVEDVIALCRALGPEVYLLGHSFGGLLALEAANRAPDTVAKVLVYEPYAPPEPLAETSAVTRAFEAMVDAPEALLERFLRDIVQLDDASVAALRRSAVWQRRVGVAHTIPREMAAIERHALRDLTSLAASAKPVRFLLGEKSAAFIQEATHRLRAMLPASDLVVLEGQGHVAMDTAPDAFERAVRAFFDDPDR